DAGQVKDGRGVPFVALVALVPFISLVALVPLVALVSFVALVAFWSGRTRRPLLAALAGAAAAFLQQTLDHFGDQRGARQQAAVGQVVEAVVREGPAPDVILDGGQGDAGSGGAGGG